MILLTLLLSFQGTLALPAIRPIESDYYNTNLLSEAQSSSAAKVELEQEPSLNMPFRSACSELESDLVELIAKDLKGKFVCESIKTQVHFPE